MPDAGHRFTDGFLFVDVLRLPIDKIVDGLWMICFML